VKILVVTQYFWPESFRINDVVSTLVEKGLHVDVLTGKPNYPEGEIYKNYRIWGCLIEDKYGANIYRVPLLPRGSSNKILLTLNYLSFIIFGMLMGTWMVRKNKYDLVFVYGLSPILLSLPGILISKLKKIKIILWVQDLWPESLSATKSIENKLTIAIVGKVVKWIYNSTDLILVQSHAFVSEIKNMGILKEIKYYPNSVDPSFYDYALKHKSEVELEYEKNKDFNVIFAGNVGIGQGVEVIVEAAKNLSIYKDIKFIIIGRGSRSDWLSEQKDKYSLDGVVLRGRLPVERMPEILSRASALLVTLTDEPIFTKTIPNKIQAYLAVGKPIIACLNGEGAKVVNEANAGFTVPAGDAKELSEAVLKLYRMPLKERDKYGYNGRAYYERKFEHEKLINELIDEFKTIAGK
jgi:glycosyltransferase involved in cell wall biosynthesis